LQISDLHKFWLVPVEFLACYWDKPAHFLKHTFLHVLKHVLDICLVCSFEMLNLFNDVYSITACQWGRLERLCKVELHIAIFKIMIVHCD